MEKVYKGPMFLNGNEALAYVRMRKKDQTAIKDAISDKNKLFKKLLTKPQA